MSDVSFSGISSGVDWSQMIEYQLAVYHQHHIQPIADWQVEWTDKLSALSDLESKLTDLRSACEDMDTLSELSSYSAGSSDETVLTAEASSSAAPGSYSIEINQLADAEVEVHDGVDESETVVNNSGGSLQFAYIYAGDTITLQVADGSTLEDLKDLINNDSDNPGVTATILDDGSDGFTSHHLRLTGDDAGSSYTISIDDATTTLQGEWGNLTVDAGVGTNTLTVDDPSAFQQYMAVIVDDDDSTAEYHIVSSVVANTITLQSNLGDNFTVAQNAYVTPRGIGSDAPGGGSSGTDEVTVSDASYFQVGKTVVIADGANNEQLVISAVDTGANTITFETNLVNDYGAGAYVTQLEGGRNFTFENADFTEAQTAQNAQIRVDGYPAGSWIERESNVIGNVIEGVTLTLLDTTGGTPVTVTVNEDTTEVKQKIADWVNAYNAVRLFLNQKTRYDADAGTAGVLLGHYGANLVETLLRNIVVSPAAGFLDGTDPYTVLGQIGIESVGLNASDSEMGKLSIDDSELDDALSEDYEGVVRLLSEHFGGYSDDNYLNYYQCSDLLTTPGKYDVQVDFDGGGSITAARMKLTSETVFRNANISGNYVIGAADNPEEALWVQVQWDGASATQSAVIRVTHGVTGQMTYKLDEILDSTDGLIQNLQDSYNDILSELQANIEEEEARLATMRERLTAKYARLETLMAQYQGLENWTMGLSQSMQSSS